jgi:hypothetical protein
LNIPGTKLPGYDLYGASGTSSEGPVADLLSPRAYDRLIGQA